MPAVGELVRCTDGSWMTRPPQSCPRGHPLGTGAMLVGQLLVSWRTHDLDMPGMRRGGVRAADWR